MATDLGKGGRSKPNARARAAAAREQQRKKEARHRMYLIGGVIGLVVILVGGMVLIYANKKDKPNAAVRVAAAPSAVSTVTTIPAATFGKVDTSALTGGPTKISGTGLTLDGKPGVFYYGAEYCPYCATERWPVVVALSRFGTWSGLKSTTSASQDVFPSTPTFSFYGSKFTSPYLSFNAVETTTNQKSGSSYTPLETPTAAQLALVNKYNSSGSIPFIDFGNKFLVQGATYKPDVLKGKSFDEIAATIPDPTTDIGKGVLASANTMTAAICEMTGGKPGSVCDTPVITKLRATLNAEKG